MKKKLQDRLLMELDSFVHVVSLGMQIAIFCAFDDRNRILVVQRMFGSVQLYNVMCVDTSVVFQWFCCVFSFVISIFIDCPSSGYHCCSLYLFSWSISLGLDSTIQRYAMLQSRVQVSFIPVLAVKMTVVVSLLELCQRRL